MSAMATFDFTTLLGSTLNTKNGEGKTAEILNGKTVLLYFSAHWCPPCKAFTPKLSKFYTDLKKSRDDFEIVFVSSDEDENTFNEYYGEMSFLSLPFSDRDTKAALSKKYKVAGIPSLVVVGSDGELITKDGRSQVDEDPEGNEFPWIPKPFEEILPKTVMAKDGSNVDAKSLDGSVLMLYFSAHWCGPCRNYTPELIKVYNELKKQGKEMELIFVSGDRDEDAFKQYYEEMPWLALNFSDEKANQHLSKFFEVEGIPSLVVMDKAGPDGKRALITKSGRPNMKNVAEFPWYPLPYGNISETVECDGKDMNEGRALIILCEGGDDDEQDDIKALVAKLAEEAKSKGGEDGLLYFYGDKPSGPVPRIRQLCKLKDDGETSMILVDIPDNGGYYVADLKGTEVTEEAVKAFLKDSGERKQLS